MTKEVFPRTRGVPRSERLTNCAGARHREPRDNAFTLIELILVIGIIVVLSGLVLSTVGYARKKGARARAETEIAAMSAALENYKADNGIYPRDTTNNTTDNLDPTTNGGSNSPSYNLAGFYLYTQLSGDLIGNQQPTGKGYFAFKPQMLLTDINGSVLAIKDPFGYSYGYSTRMASTGSGGYNPTFDLWSTVGLTINPPGTPPDTITPQWVKNW
jgi:prepilin-type N-terminal cleavage/methylation domain-containing protein